MARSHEALSVDKQAEYAEKAKDILLRKELWKILNDLYMTKEFNSFPQFKLICTLLLRHIENKNNPTELLTPLINDVFILSTEIYQLLKETAEKDPGNLEKLNRKIAAAFSITLTFLKISPQSLHIEIASILKRLKDPSYEVEYVAPKGEISSYDSLEFLENTRTNYLDAQCKEIEILRRDPNQKNLTYSKLFALIESTITLEELEKAARFVNYMKVYFVQATPCWFVATFDKTDYWKNICDNFSLHAEKLIAELAIDSREEKNIWHVLESHIKEPLKDNPWNKFNLRY